jgi:hypothetical protein
MGAIAVNLGNSARDVVLSRDPERALQISRDDVAMNELHQRLLPFSPRKTGRMASHPPSMSLSWAGFMNASPTMPSRLGVA